MAVAVYCTQSVALLRGGSAVPVGLKSMRSGGSRGFGSAFASGGLAPGPKYPSAFACVTFYFWLGALVVHSVYCFGFLAHAGKMG